MTPDLQSLFGSIDIYLFDQLLRGRITPGMRVLDAGCGSGRNVVFLLRHGYDVHAVDADPAAIERIRELAAALAPQLPPSNFHEARVEAMPLPDAWSDVVISSAVLHFARDADHFEAMLTGMWRVLRPGGLFFARLASSIGLERQVRPIGGGRYELPDGSERYLVDEPALLALTAALGGRPADPLKTTLVHGQRSMTTWVLWKNER
jgi:ubiquinone/menaquinone biosynthesis C-methylase UbiE